MAASELNSFVYKFKNLWRTGQEATLNVKCKAGNAWVELGVCLGHPLDIPPPQLHRHDHQGNSRDRRRNRRAAERLAKETNEGMEDGDKVENEHKESDKNANETGTVTKLLNKDEKLNSAEKDAPKEVSSKQDSENDEEVCQTVAEKATTYACDNCKQVFEFNKDVRYSMCDKCIVNIANKE